LIFRDGKDVAGCRLEALERGYRVGFWLWLIAVGAWCHGEIITHIRKMEDASV